MRKYLLLLFLFIFGMGHAENEVTKFLGIPIDGTKSEMVRRLKEKGFNKVPGSDMLEGEFNGEDVYLGIQTNNNKVWRISVVDKLDRDEVAIRVRFNNLISQFKENSNYLEYSNNLSISNEEDISYRMLVENYQYQVIYYQYPFNLNSYNRIVWFTISEMYGKYRIIIFYENKKNEANGKDL